MALPLEEKANSAKSVVIVGGGFAGLNCARTLAKHSNLQVTLIDKANFQQFQPLLYQVATAFLTPNNASFALREVFHQDSTVNVKMAEIVSVDLNTRTATSADGQTYQGDFLVLAAGARVNFFDTPGADKHTYPLYSLADAEKLRSRVLAVLEAADRDPSLVQKGALNFVVVGAGPTGVETAGALGDMTRHMTKGAYKDLDLTQAQVFLVDMSQKVLGAFSEKSQSYAAEKLAEHGVKVHLGVQVKEVSARDVLLSDGTRIQTHTVIWAGGLKASELSGHLGVPNGKGGRIDVEADFSVKGFPGVFALGDFANTNDADGKPLPQLASVAQQAGRQCAKNIAALAEGKPAKPFSYLDKGIMAMIGRSAAVAEVGSNRHELTGPLAFAAWLGVHAVLLTTSRAKVAAFMEWAWDYFGNLHIDPVLDRMDVADIDWNGDEKTEETPAAREHTAT